MAEIVRPYAHPCHVCKFYSENFSALKSRLVYRETGDGKAELDDFHSSWLCLGKLIQNIENENPSKEDILAVKDKCSSCRTFPGIYLQRYIFSDMGEWWTEVDKMARCIGNEKGRAEFLQEQTSMLALENAYVRDPNETDD